MTIVQARTNITVHKKKHRSTYLHRQRNQPFDVTREKDMFLLLDSFESDTTKVTKKIKVEKMHAHLFYSTEINNKKEINLLFRRLRYGWLVTFV